MKSIFIFPLLFLASTFHASMAQSPGTFTPTGNLSVPRDFHTATLLPNGMVLIAGGLNFGSGPTLTWATAEIYDPSNGSFTAIGNMTTARQQHTATVLPNGKVLIAGGTHDGGPPQASAELYDPVTGTFSATGSMTVPRVLHTATLLNNGKVLIAGGSALQTAELYDSSTGTFTTTGDMTEARVDTATPLPNGKVLITRWVDFGKPSHAELYDPATGAFTRISDMIDPNQGAEPTATLLSSGKVLIAGGDVGDFGGSASTEIYDPATGSFSSAAKMTASINAWAVATLLPEGRVLIAGRYDGVACAPVIGVPSLGTCPGTAELYDPVTNTFSATSKSQSMAGHAATLLPDGTVLLSGGWVCCGITIASAELYHPAVLLASPVLFSLSGDAQAQGAILHGGTERVVSSSDPAVAGEALEIYGTGLIDGAVIPPQVAIGGQMAEVLFFGKAPGFAGLNQINVRVPSGVAAGPAVPVRLNYIGRPSNEVSIAVR
jgi:hypothetical protein